jgi:predicted AlkP superfamily pyrophosphatase or phosphodiesterase|tara:strand:- start:8488 stop:9621 length:1134 start_codon:yes stop_codon:yes gene_type:complete
MRLSLFIFIDALGWEVLAERKFLEKELPYRRKLKSVFGYSSACVPSILSGKKPQEHGHWSFYFKNEENSPFRHFKWMQYLPFANRGRVRHQLSRFVKKSLGWTGYFELYNMPFEHLDKFDYCEKQDIFADGGMNKGEHIFDHLKSESISYHVSDWHDDEQENLAFLKRDLSEKSPRFAFLYMAAMDALLHQVGKASDQVDTKLAWYEEQLTELFAHANSLYGDVDIFICSDHGMATVSESVDLMREVEQLPFVFGEDYLAAYDSTMARFWFKNPKAEVAISKQLSKHAHGRILSEHELAELGCQFEGGQYGDMVFLLEAGKIICPSHMGTKPITGMHGYHPDHPDSDAVLLSSKFPMTEPLGITDLNALMKHEVAAA